MSASKVFFVAAEASGDRLSREVIEHLRKRVPELQIEGIGGLEMAKVGVSSDIDLSPLAVVGMFEAVKAYGAALRLANETVDAIIASKAETAVLVDSWGFTVRVAERMRKRAPHVNLVKLVGPQVWAMRSGRAKTIARLYDHVICIHDMERPYYEPLDIDVTVMGNPAITRSGQGDAKAARARHALVPARKTLLVLPGSRPSEISGVAPVLVEAAMWVKQARPETQVVFAPASNVREQFLEAFPRLRDWARVTAEGEATADVMAAADLALACSGTVTSELAVQETPFLVGYRTGWITWALARFFLFKPKHITLVNIAADDREIAPEFVQTKFRAEAMAETATRLLDKPALRAAQVTEQNKALARMQGPEAGAAWVAADAILKLVSD